MYWSEWKTEIIYLPFLNGHNGRTIVSKNCVGQGVHISKPATVIESQTKCVEDLFWCPHVFGSDLDHPFGSGQKIRCKLIWISKFSLKNNYQRRQTFFRFENFCRSGGGSGFCALHKPMNAEWWYCWVPDQITVQCVRFVRCMFSI